MLRWDRDEIAEVRTGTLELEPAVKAFACLYRVWWL